MGTILDAFSKEDRTEITIKNSNLTAGGYHWERCE